MPTIIFTDNPKPTSEAVRANGWRRGSVAELSADSCERWIRRGCAKYHAPTPVAPPAATGTAEVTETVAVGHDFNPDVASDAELRAFLTAHNVTPGPRMGRPALLRAAREILARSGEG